MMFDPFGLGEPKRSRPTFTPKEKDALHNQQGGQCNGCGQKFAVRNLTVDHIKPFSKGGGERLTNLQLLCGSCNSIKGNGTQAELKKRLKEKGIVKGGSVASKKAVATPKKAASKTRKPPRKKDDDPFKIFLGL